MKRGDIISYIDMCRAEEVNLQRGMNFRLGRTYSVILMSLRKGAPYADRIEDDGRVLIYEGHDIPKTGPEIEPKRCDQEAAYANGVLTQNGLFLDAAEKFMNQKAKSERVRVYEKIHTGIWVYNGLFELVDAWREQSGARKIFKFKLTSIDEEVEGIAREPEELEHERIIPSAVKLEVWKRDKGQCVKCGCKDNLHFDHIIPFSKGGSSLTAKNIQLLCARHNITKKDKIE